MQNTNTTDMVTTSVVDLRTFYLVLSLYDAAMSQGKIPAEVSNFYKEYLEAGKDDREQANQNLVAPIKPAYYALKQLIEGEGWAAKY